MFTELTSCNFLLSTVHHNDVVNPIIQSIIFQGVDHSDAGFRLISSIIGEILTMDVSVLMGANIAHEVADGMFCETTVGCRSLPNGQAFKKLLQTPNFRICVVQDLETVEICGALKVG